VVHVDSDVHLIATHSLLGGQHGEESQESEEGQEGEEEEEVVLLFLNDAIDSQCRKQRRTGRRGPARASPLQVATPALVDDGGRRRN